MQHTFCQVPHAGSILGLMQLSMELPDEASRMVADIESVTQACGEVRTSERLKTLLVDVVLPLGNVMNQNTSRAMAQGIKVESLAVVCETKGHGGRTLVSVVAKHLESNGSDVSHQHYASLVVPHPTSPFILHCSCSWLPRTCPRWRLLALWMWLPLLSKWPSGRSSAASLLLSRRRYGTPSAAHTQAH